MVCAYLMMMSPEGEPFLSLYESAYWWYLQSQCLPKVFHCMSTHQNRINKFLQSCILEQGAKRMPGTAITKSVVANEPGGRKKEEIFVDVIEKISVTFSSS